MNRTRSIRRPSLLPVPRHFAVFLLSVLAVGGCDVDGGPALEEGVSRELAALRASTIDDLRYRFELSIPAERRDPVTGRAEIRFRRDDPDGMPVVLDFLSPGARLRSVHVDGRSVEPAFAHDHVVLPAEAFPARGDVSLDVAFEAGDEALNRSDDFLYTLFVPDRAHFSLPVFDQPDLKARFSLTLELPGGWVAVANGPESTEVHGGPVVFAETEPLPTYLFTFAAGRFRVDEADRAGYPLAFHHRETEAERIARNREAIFDLHGTALEWLEAYTGIPLPFAKFDFVGIPSFQYGGMEHPGAVYYRASSLFLDESATQEDFLGRASLIAHETAHMWFGDLVTMPWFDDVWMKEVFANVMAAKIVHPSFPELNHDLRFFLAHHPQAYAIDRSGGTHPIRQDLENLREAGTLYGPIIYQKAPVVVRQLERMIGEEALREGLREYLDAHRFGNASWTDLVRILDARVPEDLASWSRVWVEDPGRPTVRAVLREDEEGRIGSLRLEQEDPAGRGRLWPQAFHVVLGYGADSTVALPARLLRESAEVDEARGLPTPDWVLPGGRGEGYGRFRLDDPSRARLLDRVSSVADPLVRGVAWVTLWDAVLEGEVDRLDFFERLLDGARTEDEELNLARVLGTLRTTWWRFLRSDERAERGAAIEAVLWRGVERAETRTARSAYFAAYRSVAVTDEGTARLRRVWSGEEEVPGVPLSERDRTDLAAALALRGVPDADAILDAQRQRIDDPDRLERFDFVRPALSGDATVREDFFARLLEPENRAREPWVASALSYLGHPLRAEHARRFVRPALDELDEIQRTGDIFFPGRWLDATLGGHATPEVARTVRDFLQQRDDLPRRLRRQVLQSADVLFRTAAIVYGGEEPVQ